MFKKISFPTVIIAVVLGSAWLAELFRFHGYLVLDLLAPPLVGAWFLQKFFEKKKIFWPNTTGAALLFLSIGAISLLLHSATLSSNEFVNSFFYLIRFASLFSLSIITFNENKEELHFTQIFLFLFPLLLSIAGFIQLVIKPDFTDLESLGWDPHQGRLLSTWFDPNFVGGCLAFFTPLLLGYAVDHKKGRWPVVAGSLLILIAIGLTLSRSAYLALVMGLGVLGLLRSTKMMAVSAMGLVVLSLLVSPIRARVESLFSSIEAVVTQSYTLPDDSARLRYDSWRVGWELFLDSPWIGQGYNNYKQAALEKGLIKDPNIHAASGSDSSILTILANTGILGLLPFLSLYGLLAESAWRQRKTGLGAGYLGALGGLLIHSIFVNSLLFPLFMVPFWISTAWFQKSAVNSPTHVLDQ